MQVYRSLTKSYQSKNEIKFLPSVSLTEAHRKHCEMGQFQVWCFIILLVSPRFQTGGFPCIPCSVFICVCRYTEECGAPKLCLLPSVHQQPSVLGGSRSTLQTHSLEMPAQHCAPAFPIGVYCFFDNLQMLSFQMRFRLFLVAPSVKESITHFFPCHNPSSLEFVIVCWFGKTDPDLCDHQTLHECPQSKRLCQKKTAEGIPLPTEEKCGWGAQTHW